MSQEVFVFTLTSGSPRALFDPRGKGCCCLFQSPYLLQAKLFHSPSLSTKFSSPSAALWLLIYSFHSPAAPIFYILLFQTHFPSLCISLLILIPLFFSFSHQFDPHSYASSHSPTICLILGCLSYFAPISCFLSPHHCCTPPLSVSLLPSLFSWCLARKAFVDN